MKKLFYLALIIAGSLILRADSCGGGQKTGFIVSTTEEILAGIVPIGPFAVSIVYDGFWGGDLPGATGVGDQSVHGVTNSSGLSSEPNARVPATWRFIEFDGDCAGMTTSAIPLQPGGTAPLLCAVIAPFFSITPSVYDVSTSTSTDFALAGQLDSSTASFAPSVYVTNQFDQVVAGGIVNGVFSDGFQTTLQVSIPAVAWLPSGSYFVRVAGGGTPGVAILTVFGNDPPPPPPPDICLVGLCN